MLFPAIYFVHDQVDRWKSCDNLFFDVKFFYIEIFSGFSSPTSSVHSIKLVETHLWPRSHTGNFLFEKIQRISHRTRPLLYHLFSQKRVSRTNQDSKGIKWISWYTMHSNIPTHPLQSGFHYQWILWWPSRTKKSFCVM